MKHLLTALFAFTLTAAAAEPEVIPIQVRENLRIVYQVTDDTLQATYIGQHPDVGCMPLQHRPRFAASVRLYDAHK